MKTPLFCNWFCCCRGKLKPIWDKTPQQQNQLQKRRCQMKTPLALSAAFISTPSALLNSTIMGKSTSLLWQQIQACQLSKQGRIQKMLSLNVNFATYHSHLKAN